MNPQATVIIPTFSDWGSLQTCLDCLAGQSVSPDLFEIIVANNNPLPEFPPSLRLPSNARIIHAARPGSYAARNVAMREARGEVFFFTDSDCEPDTRWIEAGLAAISNLGPYGRVAGNVVLYPKGAQWTGPALYDRIFWFRQESYAARGWSVTANLVAQRAAFDLAGPFDEDRFSGGDHEWNVRASGIGSKIVFSPETVIRHPARSSFAELASKCRRLAGGRHCEEKQGRLRPQNLYRSLFPSIRKVHETYSAPDLTDSERNEVFWIGFRLGLVEFMEIARLRYLSGKPRRS